MALIDTVEDFGGKVKSVVGDNGMILLIGGAALFAMYAFMRDSSEESATLVTPTGYTSYPDADKNANVIIDTLQQEGVQNTNTILGALDDMQNWQSEQYTDMNYQTQQQFQNMQEILANNQNSTKDYISSGLESLTDRVNNGFAGMNDKYENLYDYTSGKFADVDEQLTDIKTGVNEVQTSVNAVSGKVDKVSSQVEQNKGLLQSLKESLTVKQTTTTKKTTSKKKDPSDGGSNNDDVSSYSGDAKGSGGVTSNGVYDAENHSYSRPS